MKRLILSGCLSHDEARISERALYGAAQQVDKRLHVYGDCAAGSEVDDKLVGR
jgi:hypothetical protein